jgi:hypothetical protein
MRGRKETKEADIAGPSSTSAIPSPIDNMQTVCNVLSDLTRSSERGNKPDALLPQLESQPCVGLCNLPFGLGVCCLYMALLANRGYTSFDWARISVE